MRAKEQKTACETKRFTKKISTRQENLQIDFFNGESLKINDISNCESINLKVQNIILK